MAGPSLLRSAPDSKSCTRSEEHTSELQSRRDLVCRLLLEKKKQDSHVPAVLQQTPFGGCPRPFRRNGIQCVATQRPPSTLLRQSPLTFRCPTVNLMRYVTT